VADLPGTVHFIAQAPAFALVRFRDAKRRTSRAMKTTCRGNPRRRNSAWRVWRLRRRPDHGIVAINSSRVLLNRAATARCEHLRLSIGIAEPYKVQRWCLGNEMDGPWQIGHMSAFEYGAKAADAARQMRAGRSSLKLVACGRAARACLHILNGIAKFSSNAMNTWMGFHCTAILKMRNAGRRQRKIPGDEPSMEKQIARP